MFVLHRITYSLHPAEPDYTTYAFITTNAVCAYRFGAIVSFIRVSLFCVVLYGIFKSKHRPSTHSHEEWNPCYYNQFIIIVLISCSMILSESKLPKQTPIFNGCSDNRIIQYYTILYYRGIQNVMNNIYLIYFITNFFESIINDKLYHNF